MSGLFEISTKLAPAPFRGAPYSQGVMQKGWLRKRGLIFVSGQIAINPETNLFEGGTAGEQTERIFANLNAILKAAGSSFECVVKSTVYLADMNDFDAMNEVYAQHVGQPAPARTTIEISQLPAGALVEIDVIAYGRTKCTLGQFFFGRSR
tara:strand:+ start:210 stop:662 length:453 start_codon:yes stop_codon:yes gene_type:complete